MPMNKTECIRCQSEMEAGFIADMKEGGFAQQQWHPGEPTESFWLCLKLDAKRMVPVHSLRCPKCGYLESYAIASSL